MMLKEKDEEKDSCQLLVETPSELIMLRLEATWYDMAMSPITQQFFTFLENYCNVFFI